MSTSPSSTTRTSSASSVPRPCPDSLSPGYVLAGWEVNAGTHIESIFRTRVRLLSTFSGGSFGDLAALALEFWNHWRSLVSLNYPQPLLVAVTNREETILGAFGRPLPIGTHADALTRMNRSTCILIQGYHETFPADECRGYGTFMVQTWGAFPLPIGGDRVPVDTYGEIASFCEYLDGHDLLWADRYGRKLKCAPYVRIFAHPVIQRHFYVPTP